MKRFFKRLLGATGASSRNTFAEPPASLERLQQMFEYARRRNLCGRSNSGFHKWVGQSIEIVSEKRHFIATSNNPYYVEGTVVTQYQSLSWSYLPQHLGIYLVDGGVEFRASHDGRGPPETMPLAIDPADLAEIKCCFDYWYDEFGLPGSLDVLVNPPKLFESTGDVMRDIETYLGEGSVRAFYELFEDQGPVMWVDWGDEDDKIIQMAAEVLELDDLTAWFDNDRCDLLVTYRGTEHRIRYPAEGVADRDTTIIALNRILQPEHELRLFRASRGSDTLAFLAFSAAEWSMVEQKQSQACAEHFMAIDEKTEIFGRST